jgi:hypothetical protein
MSFSQRCNQAGGISHDAGSQVLFAGGENEASYYKKPNEDFTPNFHRTILPKV